MTQSGLIEAGNKSLSMKHAKGKSKGGKRGKESQRQKIETARIHYYADCGHLEPGRTKSKKKDPAAQGDICDNWERRYTALFMVCEQCRNRANGPLTLQ